MVNHDSVGTMTAPSSPSLAAEPTLAPIPHERPQLDKRRLLVLSLASLGIVFGDIALLLVRLSRPLPGTLDRAVDLEMAQRHLTLLIDGMRTEWATEALSGVELTLDDLRSLPNEPTGTQG